jgi:hypothetical protein
MKLRSAEADPHVIKHAAIFEHRSIRDSRTPRRPTSLRTEAQLPTERPSHHRGRHPNSPTQPTVTHPKMCLHSALQPKPPSRQAGRLHSPKRVRLCSSKHLAEQPTSRLYSADESVASHHRCQRRMLVPSMGFVPLQGPSLSVPGRPCQAEDPCAFNEPKLAFPAEAAPI